MNLAAPPVLHMVGVTGVPRSDWHRNGCLRYRLADRSAKALAFGCTLEIVKPSARPAGPVAAVLSLRPTGRRSLDHCRAQLQVAEYDDLLFAAPEESPAVLNGKRSLSTARMRSVQARRALRTFSHVLVSTQALAEEVRLAHPRAQVAVAGNDPDRAWLEQGRAIYRAWRPGDPRIIRYLPGSDSRELDFSVVADALLTFLDKHADARLEIVGPCDLSAWPRLQARIRHLPFMAFDQLAEWYASAWTTIAPLASTRFNRCKSAIKFSESASFGAPCIATPSPAMRLAGAGTARPLLAEDAQGWMDQLEHLRDDQFREHLGVELSRWSELESVAAPGSRSFFSTLRAWTERA